MHSNASGRVDPPVTTYLERVPVPLRLRAAAVLAAPVLLLGACTSDEPDTSTAPSTPSTPLASYATDSVALDRGPFCEDLSEAAVKDALGGTATSSTTYGNGDRARVTADVRDVAHEYDCTYTSADRTTARAWLFAPPVTVERAHDLARQARGGKGCRPQKDAPAFGQDSVALLCAGDSDVTASYHGLFGDAWLSCSLTVAKGTLADPELTDRTGRWCVQAAEAARA